MIRTVIKHYLIGMSSAFDLFPDDDIEDVPFNISIGKDFVSDKNTLNEDMENIGKDFWTVINRFTENE